MGQKAAPVASRDFKRDNMRMVRSMSRDVRRNRDESDKRSDPGFKLQKFANVASRLHETPKRLQELQASRTLQASGTPSRLRSLSNPGLSPAKTSPPVAQSPWARGPLRSCNQPIPRPKGKPEVVKETKMETQGQENRPGARLLFSPLPRETTAVSSPEDETSQDRSSRHDEMQETQEISEVPGWWPGDSLSSPFAFSDFEYIPRRCRSAPRQTASENPTDSRSRGCAERMWR